MQSEDEQVKGYEEEEEENAGVNSEAMDN